MQFHCRCFPTWKCRSSRFLRGAHEFPTTKERTTTRHMSSLAVAVSASLVMYSGSTASSKACWDLFWRRCIAVTNRNGRKHLRGEKKCNWNGQLAPARPGIVFFPAGSTDCLLKMNRHFYCLLASCFVCLARSPASSSGTTCYHVLLIAKGYCLAWQVYVDHPWVIYQDDDGDFNSFGCIAMVVEYLLILGRQKAATRCRWRIELHSYTSIYHNLYQFNIIFHNLSIFWPVLDGLCVWCLFESILASWSFTASGFEHLAIPRIHGSGIWMCAWRFLGAAHELQDSMVTWYWQLNVRGMILEENGD